MALSFASVCLWLAQLWTILVQLCLLKRFDPSNARSLVVPLVASLEQHPGQQQTGGSSANHCSCCCVRCVANAMDETSSWCLEFQKTGSAVATRKRFWCPFTVAFDLILGAVLEITCILNGIATCSFATNVMKHFVMVACCRSVSQSQKSDGQSQLGWPEKSGNAQVDHCVLTLTKVANKFRVIHTCRLNNVCWRLPCTMHGQNNKFCCHHSFPFDVWHCHPWTMHWSETSGHQSFWTFVILMVDATWDHDMFSTQFFEFTVDFIQEIVRCNAQKPCCHVPICNFFVGSIKSLTSIAESDVLRVKILLLIKQNFCFRPCALLFEKLCCHVFIQSRHGHLAQTHASQVTCCCWVWKFKHAPSLKFCCMFSKKWPTLSPKLIMCVNHWNSENILKKWNSVAHLFDFYHFNDSKTKSSFCLFWMLSHTVLTIHRPIQKRTCNSIMLFTGASMFDVEFCDNNKKEDLWLASKTWHKSIHVRICFKVLGLNVGQLLWAAFS